MAYSQFALRTVYIAGLICVALGISGIVEPRMSLPLEISQLPSYHPISGLCLAFLGCSLIFAQTRYKLLSRALSFAALILCALLATFYIFDESEFLQSLLAIFPASSELLKPSHIAPNSLLFLLINASCIYFFTLSDKMKIDIIALSLLGALSVGIGAVALFGYLSGIEIGYAWGFSEGMPPREGLGAIISGVGVISLIWAAALPALRSFKEFLREITLFSTLLVLIVALLSTGFAVLPVYDSLRQLAKHEVSYVATERAEEFTRFYDKASATLIDLSAKFNRALRLQNGAAEAMPSNQMQSASDSDDLEFSLTGAVRINQDGELQSQFGEGVPQEYYSLAQQASPGKVTFYGPYQEQDKFFFVAARRTEGVSDKSGSVDLARFSAEFIKTALSLHPNDPTFISLYLLERGNGVDRVFRLDQATGSLISFETSSSSKINIDPNGQANSVNKGFVGPKLVAEHPFFLTYNGIPETSYVVLAAGEGRDLYRTLNFRLMKFLLLALGFALVGGLGTFLLVRKLTTQAEKIQQETESARRSREELAKQSLREKEVLLKEIHHRVKNNLQVISSLLRLQARSAISAELKTALRESENRIGTIALLHQLLYQSRDIVEISLRSYIEQLCSNILKTFEVGDKVSLDVCGEDTQVDLNVALPCGLLVTEIVTNSVKHAFPEGLKGSVRAELKLTQPDMIELLIGDDGIGFEESKVRRSRRSLGIRLIRQLISQLKASMEKLQSSGTTYRILFPRTKSIEG